MDLALEDVENCQKLKKAPTLAQKSKRKVENKAIKIDLKNPKFFINHATSKTKFKASIDPLKRDENPNELITDPK